MALSMDPLIPGLPDEVARECLFRVPYTGFRTAKSVSKLWRDEVESAVFHHFRKSTGLSRTVIAMAQSQPTIPTTVISSSDSTEENNKLSSPGYQLTLYEPETGTWSTLPPVPSLTHGLPLFCQVAAVGHKLVVLGGWDPTSWAASDKVFIFDFVAATWRRGENMPEPRRSFFACASDFDRTIFVAGGHDEEKNALRSAVAYVVEDDMWVPLPDMTEERDECKGVFSEGEFVVFGGYSTEYQGQFGKSAERFDVGRWEWGEVETEALEVGACPRTCVGGSRGRVFRCLNGKVEVKEEVGGWREVAEVPEGVKVAPWVVGVGEEEVLVIGSACHGEVHEGWVVDVEDGRWRKVVVPEKYSGHIQEGCCLYI